MKKIVYNKIDKSIGLDDVAKYTITKMMEDHNKKKVPYLQIGSFSSLMSLMDDVLEKLGMYTPPSNILPENIIECFHLKKTAWTNI